MSELERDYMGEDEYGSVDLFGLDEFGQPQGMSQNWGAAIGAATQTGVAIAVKELTNMDKYSEGIGALAGIAVGGAMWAMPNARAAGVTAMITSLVSGGLRQMHAIMSKLEGVKTITAEAVKTGTTPPVSVTQALARGMGLVEIENMPRVGYDLHGNGFGLPTVERQVLVPGSMGLDGSFGMPPQLVGAGDYGLSQNPAAQQAQLVGPGVSGLGAHYGSTIFG